VFKKANKKYFSQLELKSKGKGRNTERNAKIKRKCLWMDTTYVFDTNILVGYGAK